MNIGQYKFKEMDSVKYLRVLLNGGNERLHIKEIIQLGYKAFYISKNTLKAETLN